MYILFGSYGKQFVKIDKIPNSNKFFSVCLSVRPSLCLSVPLSICLSAYLSICLFVCLSPGYLKKYSTDFHESLWKGRP